MKHLFIFIMSLAPSLIMAQHGSDTLPKDTGQVFVLVEQMPEFPGGDKGLFDFIKENVKYPPPAHEAKITGTVYATFIVTASGEITGIKVIRGVNKYLDAEAVRVIKSMPHWKPGRQSGKQVSVQYILPIKFSLAQ